MAGEYPGVGSECFESTSRFPLRPGGAAGVCNSLPRLFHSGRIPCGPVQQTERNDLDKTDGIAGDGFCNLCAVEEPTGSGGSGTIFCLHARSAVRAVEVWFVAGAAVSEQIELGNGVIELWTLVAAISGTLAGGLLAHNFRGGKNGRDFSCWHCRWWGC